MLRPYQQHNKNLITEAFKSGKQAIIDCMPTGAGKTVCFADYAKDCITDGFAVLIICNRKELITQAQKKLNSYGIFPALIIPGKKDKYSNIYLASIDTLRNRVKPTVNFVIIDEAHIRAFDPIVLYYKAQGARIIGATATPIRYGKKFIDEFPDYTGQLCDVYDDLIIPVQLSDLIKEEFLVPAITYGVELDLSGIKKKGNDYDEKALFDKFNKPKRYAGVVSKYQQFCSGQKALIFNINVQDSINMAAEFTAAGIPSAHVDGMTPLMERDRIFADFQQGKLMVLNNCSVATTGYDEPSIEVIIVNRPTMSMSLWLQMCGRGARPHQGKAYFSIIDMGGNVWAHGFWQQDREWSLDPKFVSRTKGAAPIGDCAKCGALIPLNIAVCPYCEAINKKKEETERKMAEAEFTVLDADNLPVALKKPLYKMTVQELEQYRELKQYAIGWIVRQLTARGEAALLEYANYKNYSKSWAYKQIEFTTKNRDDAKISILQFIQANGHLSDEHIGEYAAKKMKNTHSKEEIEIAIPKIIVIADQIKKGIIKLEL
jgi:superfamily II DNA or RNA helicase